MAKRFLGTLVAAALVSSTAAIAQPVPAAETISADASTLRGANPSVLAGVTFGFVAFLLFLFEDEIFDNGGDGFGGGTVPTSP